MKATAVRTIAIAILIGLSVSIHAMADAPKQINVAAGDLVTALESLAKQADIELVYQAAQLRGLSTKGVSGILSAQEALKRLLDGTNLRLRTDESTGAMLIVPPAAAPKATSTEPLTTQVGNGAGEKRESRGFWSRFRLGQSNFPSTSQEDAQNRSRSNGEREGEDEKETQPHDGVEVEEVLVIGTNIRGVYPASSPVQVYSVQDIARTGAVTTEQFIQRLPQNLGSRSPYGANAGGDRGNPNAVAGIDLRGLGIGTTLTLMNGRRMGLASSGRITDVSMIPASAIERVEVLTDGASAIYGSDAVGGVVNFILRDDHEGAETRVSYGSVTDGGLLQYDATQTFGDNWGSGHGLISYNYFEAEPLEVADRDYASGALLGTLTPDEKRHNLLATLAQDITDRFSISSDVVLSRRDITVENSNILATTPSASDLTVRRADTNQAFASLALDYDFSPALHGSFKASFAETQVDSDTVITFFNLLPPGVSTSVGMSEYSGLDLTAMLDGALFALPGGDARFSLGGGIFHESFDTASGFDTPSPTTSRDFGRRTTYGFGELFLPLIGAERNMPLVHRLELSLAARYTRYDDDSKPALNQEFGDNVDPKFGLLWAPIEALRLRATYGTSFRAPSLTEFDDRNGSMQVLQNFPVPFPSGLASTLIVMRGRPVEDLGPETADTYTLGFDIRPGNHPGLSFSGTYYSISYEDRIAVPPASQALVFLGSPQLYPAIVYQPPSAQYIADRIQATPEAFRQSFIPGIDLLNPQAAAQALFSRVPNAYFVDNRSMNLSRSEQDGVDIAISNSFSTSWGELHYGANATYILHYEQQVEANSPFFSVVNVVSQPVDLRSRVYAGLSRGGFDGTLSVNYADRYLNHASSSQGAHQIHSWTTIDANLSYDFGGAKSGLLDGARLSLSVQNLLDDDPPFVAGGGTISALALVNPVGFDPANANPLGRLAVLGLTKQW